MTNPMRTPGESNDVDELFSDEAHQLFLRLLGRHAVERFYIDETNPDEAGTRDIFQDRPAMWLNMVGHCQSPIEKILLAHLLFIDDGYDLLDANDYPFGDNHIVTTIEPQGKVGSYSADFLVTVRLHHLVRQIVIECDGHDFHERTKQQAAHDRARDRAMTKIGVSILRYTGSEIFREPQKCADEIEEHVGHIRSVLEDLLPGWGT